MVAAHRATESPGVQTAQCVVEVEGLTRTFAGRKALDDVSFRIPTGMVIGLVGENGAGKTTLIKHLLGLLKPQAGQVRVFGLNPVTEPVQVLGRIGYLAEEPDLPGWMRIDELLRFISAFYPAWDGGLAEKLQREFGLEGSQKLKNLSKGQRSRAGLITALAYRPELLVLDEPSSGLDPIVRRDILGAIIRTAADEGRTVLFSSHLLSEIERVCDRVAMIRSGRIVFHDSLERIKEAHKRLTLHFDDPLEGPPELAGALSWDGAGRDWAVICAVGANGAVEKLKALGAQLVSVSPVSLEDIFVARTGSGLLGGL